MDAIATLTTQYTQQYPDLLPRVTQAVSPDRFWCDDGFLVQEYLCALYYHVWRWGFADEFPRPDDDAGWRRAKDAGFRFKTWLTRRDARVRKLHERRQGEERRIDERFSVLVRGYPGPMHPRDPLIAPQDRFNCRCRLAFTLE